MRLILQCPAQMDCIYQRHTVLELSINTHTHTHYKRVDLLENQCTAWLGWTGGFNTDLFLSVETWNQARGDEENPSAWTTCWISKHNTSFWPSCSTAVFTWRCYLDIRYTLWTKHLLFPPSLPAQMLFKFGFQPKFSSIMINEGGERSAHLLVLIWKREQLARKKRWSCKCSRWADVS